MNKQLIIALSLLGAFAALTGVFFGIRGGYESIPGYICQYYPISSTVGTFGSDIICAVTTNFTISCGASEIVDVVVKKSCEDIGNGAKFEVGLDRYYLYNEYVCRTDNCNRDETLYYDNIISSFMIAGVLSATLALGSAIYAIVLWCASHHGRDGQVGPY